MSQTTTNRRIAAASFIIMAATIIGYVVSLFKEMIVARAFGLNAAMDAFYAALTAPNFIINIVLSSYSILFIPVYVSFRRKDADDANMAASVAINTVCLILGAVSLVLYFGAGPVVAALFSGFSPETAHTTARYLQILAATVFLSGIVGAFISILNSCERFLAPALSTIVVTLSIMAFVIFGAETFGGSALAAGQTVGIALQIIVLYIAARRMGYRHHFTLNLRHPAVSEILESTLSFLAITVLWSVSPIVNRTMSSWLPEGSIAGLAYADKLIQAPISILLSSVFTAMYPYFARQIADKNTAELKDTLISSLKLTAFLMVPMTVAFIIYARPIITLLFQRGAFNAAASDLTSTLLAVYSLQFLSYAPMAITMRLLMAMRKFSGIMYVFVVSIVLNAALNYVFMKILNPPAAGIALAAAVNTAAMSLFFYVLARRELGPLSGISIAVTHLRAGLLSLPAGCAMYFVYEALARGSHSPGTMIAGLIISGGCGIAAYSAGAWMLNMEEFQRIMRLLQRRFGSARS